MNGEKFSLLFKDFYEILFSLAGMLLREMKEIKSSH